MSSNKVLVIGGGPAGLEAARCVAELGGEVVLIEKRERLGGTPDRENYAKLTHHWRDASEAMAELASSITASPNIDVKYQAEVKGLSGEEGNFEVQIETASGSNTFNTVAVQFNSTANPNMSLHFTSPPLVASGARVRVIRRNSDSQSQDLYSTIIGYNE